MGFRQSSRPGYPDRGSEWLKIAYMAEKCATFRFSSVAAANMKTPKKTLTLIVGAGASFEAGLPLGSDLRTKIANILDIRYDFYDRQSGDALIDEAFRRLVRQPDGRNGDINKHLHASWRIRDAMPQAISIDNFIDAHRDDELISLVGKLAIVRSILMAESASRLSVDERQENPKIKFSAVQETWFNAFFQLLTENCRLGDLKARFSNVAIICFNYDRCIEHYLFHSLKNYYGISDQDAADTIANLEIYHPYGMVGALPWQDRSSGIQFGQKPSTHKLIEIAGQILTFTEGSNVQESHIGRIRKVLSSSERITFLGFAFHRLNLELLFPPPSSRPPTKNCSIYATGIGISEPDSKVIKRELFELSGFDPDTIYIAKGTPCAKIFDEYRRSLTLK